jgi:4-hydroxybenzoyl-CoA thioesterase
MMLDNANVPDYVRGDYVVNRRDLTVEWGHCDPAGIVFHPRFIEYFDWCCVELIENAVGATQTSLKASHGFSGIPIVDMEVRFLRRITYDDRIQIYSAVAAIKSSSFKIRHCLVKDGEVAVECQQTRVWCHGDAADPKRLKSHPIPPDIVARLTASRGG